jgi:flagellar hook-basal body complex protein FliE
MTRIDPSSLLQMRSMILQQNAALSRAAGVDPAGIGGAAAQATGGNGFNAAMGKALGALEGASSAEPAAPVARVTNVGGPGSADFTSTMRKALDDVSDLQSRAEDVSGAYERGETTDIAAVMLARQQADIGFQATLQVRNKLLAAYKDIMSMPV